MRLVNKRPLKPAANLVTNLRSISLSRIRQELPQLALYRKQQSQNIVFGLTCSGDYTTHRDLRIDAGLSDVKMFLQPAFNLALYEPIRCRQYLDQATDCELLVGFIGNGQRDPARPGGNLGVRIEEKWPVSASRRLYLAIRSPRHVEPVFSSLAD